ncbi:immunoglobulin gamma-1 heavy chain-like [Thamnophis elegans]|uniref:immunoglobulin gamma-1 heavy chain-like n=1 Tax=Thamnophis elegans TaxID=35005 RepID=UPI001377DC88|nr:immunoglobulin gamma-1 heavy chain-like [Thamnophis elegans]
MTPHSLILIILAAFSRGGLSQIVLTQSDESLKKPGESHKLTCAVTGFNVNSKWMNWIRQKPGQGLECLVSYYTSSDNSYSPTNQGRFTASKDSFNFYLQMNNLKAEDTAVYYCTGFNSRCKSHSFFTMTLHSLILIMLASFSRGGHSQVVLTQSDAALNKPGESHKLTCAVTGFNVNSNWMGWIRQKPGQGLEWIVYYYSSSNNYYSPTIQGRFTASKGSSNFYLQMNNLKAEDTAVYYCARDTVK